MSLKETALWRVARGAKRKLLPPRGDGPLPAEACAAALSAIAAPVALEAGRPHDWTLRIENRGGEPWACEGPNPVRLFAQWKTHLGENFGLAHPFPFQQPIYPGEIIETEFPIPTPEFVGDFQISFELAQSDDVPFSLRNQTTRPLTLAVPVQGRRDSDIDYHAVYRSANLGSNHWWVVGAYQSKEQYERSSAERLGMLVQYGLTPDSRVLDIGCGTGQMGDALANYLTANGAYFGTDIGAEAIAFCQSRFTQPNFVFRRGEMTRIPFQAETDGLFDMAIFFSVFTHTFTDETALLLSEAKRMLKPTGTILADVICSPLVERMAGNRGEMIVNKDHFLRLARMLNLEAETIGTWPWNPHAERFMFRLRSAR